jgi:hypothetical protein
VARTDRRRRHVPVERLVGHVVERLRLGCLVVRVRVARTPAHARVLRVTGRRLLRERDVELEVPHDLVEVVLLVSHLPP